MAIIKKYSARIVKIQNSIDGVYTLILESLGKPFKYNPGQFLHLAIDEYDPAGQWPDSRCFSMQSSPDDELIKITYSIKGKFTGRMQQELKPGNHVTLKLPYGDLFTQPHNKSNTVFIAGGTGITPFLSLFTHDSFQTYIKPRIYLGFRSKTYNIYEDELKAVKHCELRVYYENIDGLIEINEIFFDNGKLCDYFISGPPVMIRTFKEFLIRNGVLSNQILTDDWE
jgi:NAD(P)H-flavin reductase